MTESGRVLKLGDWARADADQVVQRGVAKVVDQL